MIKASVKKSSALVCRNHGIDLLRIVSMIMVICLHIVNQGGAINWSGPTTWNNKVGWLIRIACYCAVNCFALISGFVMVDRPFKYHKIVNLWFQIAFYTIGITVLFAIFEPQLIGKREIYNAIFPIVNGQYWYFTAYFAMFFFIPFLNRLLNLLTEKEIGVLMITLIVLFSIVPTIGRKDIFSTRNGYNMLWLAAMYIIGAGLRKCSFTKKISTKGAWIAFISCVLITWISQHAIEKLPSVFAGKIPRGFLVLYTSPTILITAISLLIIFSRINIKSKILLKPIAFFSSTSFGVYLIHTNPLVFNYIFHDAFSAVPALTTFLYILAIIASAIAIFLACSIVEWLRIKLFCKIKIDALSIKITIFVKKCFQKIRIKE